VSTGLSNIKTITLIKLFMNNLDLASAVILANQAEQSWCGVGHNAVCLSSKKWHNKPKTTAGAQSPVTSEGPDSSEWPGSASAHIPTLAVEVPQFILCLGIGLQL
jgi:hypothetical protein